MSKGWFLIPLLLTLSAHAEDWPGEQWPSDPTPSGSAIEALEQYAFPPRDDASREGVRTDALLVIQDGRLVYERYAGPTTAKTAHLTWSISKSLMATVFGVAYREKRFALDDPAAKYYPPLSRHPGLTLADLFH